MNPAALASLLFLLVAFVPLVILARVFRVYPHRPLILAALLLPVVATVLVFIPGEFSSWRIWTLGILDGLLVLLAGFDLFQLPKQRDFSAARSVSGRP